jgi:hypothetical protein
MKKKLKLPFMKEVAITNEDLARFDYKIVRKLSYFRILLLFSYFSKHTI